MLLALFVCAGTGIMIVLIPGSAIIGRVCGCGLLTALAIAFCMPASAMIDRPAKRRVGEWALGATVVTYIASLAAVWSGLVSRVAEERCVGTALVLAGAGVASTVALAAMGTAGGRIAGRAWMACALAAAILALAGIWFADRWTSGVGQKLLEIAWLLCSVGAIGSVAMIGAGTDRAHWRWIGVLAAAAAVGMGTWGIWFEIHESSQAFIEGLIVAGGVAQANFVLRFELPPRCRWMHAAAIAAMAATCAGMTDSNFKASRESNAFVDGDDTVARLTAAAGIAAGCATLAVIILHRYHRRVHPLAAAVAAEEIRSISLRCPGCGRAQNAPVGSAPCVGCGLIISVRVARPRCVLCGYDLMNLDAPRCPECGAPAPARGVAIASAPDAATG